MAFVRSSISDFSLANAYYAAATVTVYAADAYGARTTTLAPLFEAVTGTAQLTNPQTLSSLGKFVRPVYVDRDVVAVVTGTSIETHETGVITTNSYTDYLVDPLTGDGTTTVFALSRTVAVASLLDVVIDGARQKPDIAYTVSGLASLTFTEAPPAGAEIFVVHSAGPAPLQPVRVGPAGPAGDGGFLTLAEYTGNGVTTAFSLGQDDITTVMLAIDGVVQPSSSYTLAGSTVTCSEAPPSGSLVDIRSVSSALTEVVVSTYTASGTGGVPRAVTSKLADTVSREDYSSDANFFAAPYAPVAVTYGSLGSSTTDTGAYETAYTGGTIPNPTVSGRSTPHLFALVASQNCRSEGPARAVNIASIYCHARGNVSGNYSSRQSDAWTPQSVNLASEECWVWGGFRGLNAASIYSGCENESNANLSCRSSYATGRNSVNIASSGGYAGRGGNARLTVTTLAGVVTAVTINRAGSRYNAGDTIIFYDRLNAGAAGAAATVLTVDGAGGIASVNLAAGGTGYSSVVDCTVDNGSGDFSANVATSGFCETWGTASANLASSACKAEGSTSANIAGDTNVASGQYSVTLGSSDSTASGQYGMVLGSAAGVASATISAVIAGNICQATAAGAVVFGRRTINNTLRSIALGDNGAGAASTANRKFHALPNGDVQASGTFTGATVFTDFAEYFRNSEPGVIPLGTIVSLTGSAVQPARAGDRIAGVVSGTAGLVLGDSPFTWAGRYLTGEFGEPLYEDAVDEDTGEPIRVQVENPDYDPAAEQIPRSQRPEDWSCIGLVGQVHVRVAASVEAGAWVASDGTGTKTETRLLAMEIKRPFDQERGYAVALCLLR